MKRIVLALVLVISILMMTACSSSAGTTTESTTGEPDVIIPLYASSKESEIRNVTPIDLYNYDTFVEYFNPVTPTGRTLDKGQSIDAIGAGSTFTLNGHPTMDDPDKSYSVDIYFYRKNTDSNEVVFYCECEGFPSSNNDLFMPLWYNQTKKCLVGYYKNYDNDANDYTSCDLMEMYYCGRNSLGPASSPYEGDPSNYGF